MNSKAIVTLADSNYFELLEELINSIKAHHQSKNISIIMFNFYSITVSMEKMKLYKKSWS